jgi:hypothetical protein
MSTVGDRLKSFRRRRRSFSLAVASPPCEQGEAGGSPGQGKITPSVSSVPLWLTLK